MVNYERPRICVGYQIGKLKVISATNQKKNGYIIWNCQCDCGNIIQLDTRCLQRRTVKDCGCVTKVKPGQKDLTGLRFGMLVALHPTDDRDRNGGVVWLCRCDCGNEILAPSGQLLQGYRKSCDCLRKPPRKNWVGKRFGKLVVTEYVGKENGVHLWNCRCDCGNTAIVRQSNLKIGHTTSCGCLNDPREKLHFVDGTCVEAIRSNKLRKNNTSGVRGVYLNKKSGKWIAQITFKRKCYSLGSYSHIDEAAAVRKAAEERLFGEFLDWYYNERQNDKK